MDKIHLHNQAQKIAREAGFVLNKEIYRGIYYSPDNVRCLIFDGKFKGKKAVLKIYNDPRLTDEPVSQVAFNKINKSKILVAPEVYAYKVASPNEGWLIMEKLPEGGQFFSQPVKDKKKFAELFLEYRMNFPQKPTRPLVLAENLSADEFHAFRINRWLELATAKELVNKQTILKPKEFIPRFEKGLDLIRKEFKQRKMIWCHGHFKPHELYQVPDRNLYYLTDFAHSKMYPEGYELAFIIWADWLMYGDWKLPYKAWKKGVNEWLGVLRPVAKKLDIKKFNSLMTASLAERIMGTLLADICASDMLMGERNKRVKLLYSLLDEFLTTV